MPKSTLTWYKSQANKIMKDLRKVKQKDIATELNKSPQLVNQNLKEYYPRMIEDVLRMLALAEYEVVKKEEP